MNFAELTKAEFEQANRIYAGMSFAICDPESDRTWAGRQAGEIVVLGRLQDLGGGALELGGIWVRPDRRGEGLARRMVAHVLAEGPAGHDFWCVPFIHLRDFYLSCGMAEANEANAPKGVRRKISYCREMAHKGIYEPVCLLAVRRKTP